mmetsp:Transcript_20552/g.37458  ORF Transcript_20552/g.37458 Transcript_20552/m.37458 type:complete len:465 (-) Transcript_20552:144-1538(-)|eukprot:CAMPEP_0196134926 /NCGR_PEP_ID=MMETSP0910-20130528/3719_1 /TAXON_ID=49265 /ORGANISM="Thalassiosira rotula, Strain GSO102" /LENGTH=464 /DNA_ID=CAMNT_0041394977 /DNA_START=75 /DNA_END=1469 /DNA_ORIENTATION=-
MKRMLGITAVVYYHSAENTWAFTSTLRPSKIVTTRPLPSTATTSLHQYAATINIAEDAPRDIPSFEEWASYGGIQKADGFQLISNQVDNADYLDISAMTTQDIPASTPVVYVPSECILSANAAMQEFAGCIENDVLDLLKANGYGTEMRQYYLILKILSEVEKGTESPWYQYLNSLPRYYSNGASMTVFCYSVVPPLVSRLCKDERARLKNLNMGKRGIPFLSNDTKGNDELWKWAYQVVYTRGFETENGTGDYCIAPMADMFNHATEANVALAYDEYGNCYVQTLGDVPANSPLCMSYGDPTNPSFLLSRYGFLDMSSPATFCKILPSHVSEELKNLGYAHNNMLFYKDTGDVSEAVWDILLYMGLGETDASLQRQFYDAHMHADFATKAAMHEQYYPVTAAKLAEHIDTFLGDLQELQEKGQYGGNAVEHPRLPLIMRHNEFVRNTFLAVRSAQGLEQNTYA